MRLRTRGDEHAAESRAQSTAVPGKLSQMPVSPSGHSATRSTRGNASAALTEMSDAGSGRALETVVRRYSQYFKVVLVTGPRQVGKTTMLKHLMEEDERAGISRAYVTLDNTAIRQAD